MVKNATVKVSPTAPVTVVLAAGGTPANKQEKPETRKDAGDAAALATGAPMVTAAPMRVTIDSVARKFFTRTGLRTDITDFQPMGDFTQQGGLAERGTRCTCTPERCDAGTVKVSGLYLSQKDQT
jgi:hypothetical protein